MKNNMEILKENSDDTIIEAICINGKFKDQYGVLALTNDNRPKVFIGDTDGKDDYITTEKDINENYKIVKIH